MMVDDCIVFQAQQTAGAPPVTCKKQVGETKQTDKVHHLVECGGWSKPRSF